MLDSAGIP